MNGHSRVYLYHFSVSRQNEERILMKIRWYFPVPHALQVGTMTFVLELMNKFKI
jgi:hypothetical protein